MATFPSAGKVAGTSTGCTADLNTTYGLLQNILGPVVLPSGDVTGATDVTNVNAAVSAYGWCELVAGQYYGNATVTFGMGQWLYAAGRQLTFWNCTAALANGAFQWVHSGLPGQYGTGGIPIGRGLSIVGHSGTVCPSDSSVGLQMGDIPQLQCDVAVTNCQTGLLLQNANAYTEQGQFRIFSIGNTNPVVAQVAASGGAGRTGSFARCQLSVYHDETVSGSFGGAGVQLLNGAQWQGGYIRQYGNFSGTGQASVFDLFVSGTFGGTASYIFNAELTCALEWDGSGTAPGAIHIASGCSVQYCWGGRYYGTTWGTGTSQNGTFQFYGPVTGPPAASVIGAYTNTVVSSGFPSGVTGSVNLRLGGNATDDVRARVNLTLAASTTIANGATLFTLPAGFVPAGSTNYAVLAYNPFGTTSTTVVVAIAPSTGVVSLVSASITSPAGGTSTIRGTLLIPLVF